MTAPGQSKWVFTFYPKCNALHLLQFQQGLSKFNNQTSIQHFLCTDLKPTATKILTRPAFCINFITRNTRLPQFWECFLSTGRKVALVLGYGAPHNSVCFNSCKRRWRASAGLQLWLAKLPPAARRRGASCNALLISSCAAPLKQNADALSTFLILLFCVSKCKQGERLCGGEWDTRQSFSEDFVHDTKRVRECWSYTNIPEITGKL